MPAGVLVIAGRSPNTVFTVTKRDPILLLLVAVVCPLATGGCDSNDKIVKYRVPKPELVYRENHAPAPDRTLAAIVLWKKTSWFFKLSGPNQLVADQFNLFQQLIKSIRFPDEAQAEPFWTAPTTWRQLPGKDMRHATLLIPTPLEDLELAVTPLPIPIGDRQSYVLLNINRWRNELGLTQLDLENLSDYVDEVVLENSKAVLMNSEGRLAPKSMGRGQFAEVAPVTRSPSGPPAPDTNIAYVAPDAWSVGQRVVSRGGITIRFEAAFEVMQGQQRIDITISKFPAAMANPLPNINRWRRQIGLSSTTTEQLKQDFKEISLGEKTGKRIELESPADVENPEVIYGVITSHSGMAWFIKLKGNRDLAHRERRHYDEFVQSIRFPSPSG